MSGFDEQFQLSALASHPHERRGGGTLPTRMIRLDSPAHEATDPATGDLVVGLVLGGRAGAAWGWDGARPNTTTRRRPGTLGVSPPGAVGRFEVDGPSSMLIVALPFAALAERLAPDLTLRRDLGALHDAYTEQRTARALCLRLWDLTRRPGGVSDLAIDWLAEQLAVQLAVQLAGPEARSGPERRGRLGVLEAARVRAAAERIDADVSDLARAAAMPVRTFRRRFQASFGTSPHRWLVERRIERAKHMMRDRDLTLGQIAIDLGFASQSHFGDAFRRIAGTSPGRYRGHEPG